MCRIRTSFLSNILGVEGGETPPYVIALQQPDQLLHTYPGRLLPAARPAECLGALEPLDDLDPPVPVPHDRLEGPSVPPAKHEHRLVEGMQPHLVLDDVRETGRPLAHVGRIGSDVVIVRFEIDVHLFLLIRIQE